MVSAEHIRRHGYLYSVRLQEVPVGRHSGIHLYLWERHGLFAHLDRD